MLNNALISLSLLALFACTVQAVHAQGHEADILYGFENGHTAVMQPTPHPVRIMARPQPTVFLQDVGMDFFTPDGWLTTMLQSCRVQQVWISPGLIGTKSGFGNVFCPSGCINQFSLPTSGTAHHHFIFSASQPGVYVWDMQAVNGVDYQGRALPDLPYIYRIYFVANPQGSSVNRLFGSVQPASQYVGSSYNLMLTVQLKTGASVVAQSQLPPNDAAIYDYMVGFTQSGTYDVVAKLDKHLSVKAAGVNLLGAQQRDWVFGILGDVNNDDRINDEDLLQVLFAFGSNQPLADLNGDGVVNDVDLLIVLFNFGLIGEGRQ